eukprot:g2170.t1
MASTHLAPIKVVVTGAAGQIGYSLLPRIASGEVFGMNQPIILCMLEIPQALPALDGVRMELEDCAFSTLHGIIPTADPAVAFKDCDVAVLVGGFPRKKGMLRKDLIQKNTGIFKSMGEALNNAKSTCKVLVVANPANSNCRVALKSCKKIPAKNFTCLTRLDQNRAYSQIANKVGVPVRDVNNIIIWGNHSKSQYPDVDKAYVMKNGGKRSVIDAVNDMDYLHGDFISTVQQRGAAVIDARGASSALSAANAALDHLRTWLVTGTKPGQFVSMGIYSQGHYGIAKDIVFSFPLTCANGEYKVVEGMEISHFAREKLNATQAELLQEASDADEILGATSKL